MKTQGFKNKSAKLCYLLFIDAVYRKDKMQFSYYSLYSKLQNGDMLKNEEENSLS